MSKSLEFVQLDHTMKLCCPYYADMLRLKRLDLLANAYRPKHPLAAEWPKYEPEHDIAAHHHDR